MNRKRVAVLISGRGSNMAALIEAAKRADYPAEIVLVVSNVPDAGGLATAAAAGIATATVDHARFGKDRAAFERALQDVLTQHRIDLGSVRAKAPALNGRKYIALEQDALGPCRGQRRDVLFRKWHNRS